MNVNVEISVGEFFDKLTILEIKHSRIKSDEKLANVKKELDALNDLLTNLSFSKADVEVEVLALREVNEELWSIEDEIRLKESKKVFDEKFIELARAVYITNDRRSKIKYDNNQKLGSDFVEEKSYEDY